MNGAACFLDFNLWQLGAPELQSPDARKVWKQELSESLKQGLPLHGLLLPNGSEPGLLKVNATIDRLESLLDTSISGLLLLEEGALTPQIVSYAQHARISLADSVLVSRCARLRSLPHLRALQPPPSEPGPSSRASSVSSPPRWERTTPTRMRAGASLQA